MGPISSCWIASLDQKVHIPSLSAFCYASRIYHWEDCSFLKGDEESVNGGEMDGEKNERREGRGGCDCDLSDGRKISK